ncbi:MAG: L-seryl-tRNA(Sec) selenium transferase [Candidatus Xenobium sp.]|jgi:L-seryl-tRNA(Ser) seleniumtransferase|nr:L-seryl-tRNA(Sec) selenium transferase [Burkholderiales bacterium]
MNQPHPGRGIPSLDLLLRTPEGLGLLEAHGRIRVLEALRDGASSLRRASRLPADPAGFLLEHASRQLQALNQPSLRRVLNVTGVILHTNLGRSILAPVALEALQEAASGPTNLELDLEQGRRGSRQVHVRDLLALLTGAPSALVVNNCAAAVMLTVATLARNREVVVSRGEMVEIGDSFRLPEILSHAGARLVEVGTTNRTRLEDYRAALGPDTGLVMVSHPSNYRIEGFTESPDPIRVAALAREHTIPSFLDLGSGLLLDPAEHGLPNEPTVPDAVAAGFDLVAFSGDKLLGGPQAGILLGRADLLRTMSQTPLARAVRIGKLPLAALEATLRLYLDPRRVLEELPTMVALRLSAESLRKRAETLADDLRDRLGGRVQVEVVSSRSTPGGGGMPGAELSGWCVRLVPPDGEQAWAERLRREPIPVLATCRKGGLHLDLRTLPSEDEPELIRALESTAP